MKRFRKRAAALALALVLGTSPVASASVALGDDLQSVSLPLSQSTQLTTGVFWSNTYSDLRTERYITYSPNQSVTPMVAYGDKILSKQTLSAMAQGLEADGSRVVGGLNGDYFVVATGAPLGLVVADGVLRSSASYLYGVGFRDDGSVFIGQPQLSVTATFLGHTLIVAGVNKIRTASDGYYLLTDDFSSSTQNSQPGVDVILSPVLDNLGQSVSVDLDVSDAGSSADSSDTETDAADEAQEAAADSHELTSDDLTGDTEAPEEIQDTLIQSAKPTVGGRVTYVVEQVLQSTGSIDIPEGKAVLTINNKSNAWLVSQAASLQPGDTLQLDVTSPDDRWETAAYAVGGMYKLVTSGAVESGLDAERAPRSAVGVKADGTAVFYTIDGRQSGYSVGATLTQVAQRLVELGCVEAVCLDGGGSTTIGATDPTADALSVLNKPSDGYERAVSNAIFLVSSLQATGTLSYLSVTPGDALLLAGASVQLSATGVDTAWYSKALTGAVAWSAEGGGSVSADGVFTAGASAGTSTVKAASGGVTGSASVTVISAPDTLSLSNEATGAAVTALALSPGQTVDLKASAGYKKLALTAQDTCFTWTADASAGTVDANGLFTAAASSGTGNLTVAAGGKSLTISVSVTGHVLPLEDFEGSALTSFTSSDTVQAALETASELVRFGTQSLRLDYDAAAGSAGLTSSLALTAGEKYLNLWVYGDGSGNALTATLADSAGTLTEAALTTLDFTGWSYVSAALPTGAVQLSSLTVRHTDGSAAGGTIYLDQLTTSNEPAADLAAPVVTLTLSGRTLQAAVTDTVTHSFDKSRIAVLWDGKALDFTWDAAKGLATAALPADDGLTHRVSVTAADVSGNIGRSAADVASATQTGEPAAEFFTDMTGHWAQSYVDYLYQQGVTNGVASDAGTVFQPEKQITRGEFFLMVARWMGLDTAAYADVALPFDDAGSIADWALPGVKAMYAMGILKGSRDGTALNANAAAPLSRAEAMVILGRIQPGGYPQPALTFDDAAAVPAWALSYVQSLVGQGVVSGYDNKVNPTDPVKRAEVAKMLYTLR